MEEIWKDVDGTEGKYVVSSLSKVKLKTSDKPLKPKIDRYGYPTVKVLINGKFMTKTVHRIVATAFIPNPLLKKEVNHINGIKTDNSIDNLEWVTMKENQVHAWKSGLKKPSRPWKGKFGKEHFRSIPIIAIYPDGTTKDYNSGADAERETGIKKNAINAVCRGKRKSHKNIVYKYKQTA